MLTKSKITKFILNLPKETSLVLNRFIPGWASKKIDTLLLIPKIRSKRSIKVPKGFHQFVMKTPDGDVQAYQTGMGPTVVFVHGWGGGAFQFFPLMRGLSKCGFTALAFDHLGHGQSDEKQATIHQSVATTNFVLNFARNKTSEGLSCVVGHATGCIAIANAKHSQIRDIPLLLISPIFNYKLLFLKKLVSLNLHSELIKQYASQFAKVYKKEYEKLELARNLDKYADVLVIAHDESDAESPIADSINFCEKYPLTRLLVTKEYDHVRIINSESVWHELKTHLNYDDTTTSKFS